MQPFFLLSFIASLLVINTMFMLLCLLPTGCPADGSPQTSSGAEGICICYHSEALHQSPPPSNVTNHRSPPTSSNTNHSNQLLLLPPPTMPPFTPFTGHVPPPTGLRVTPLGVPGNVSTPILRSFQPFQSQPSSTSEENRKRSIVRMNSTKPKRRQATQLQNEVSVSNPIINTDLAILLFPVSV